MLSSRTPSTIRAASLRAAPLLIVALATAPAPGNVYVMSHAFAPKENRTEEIAQFSDAPSAWATARADSSGGSARFGTGTHDPLLGGPLHAVAFAVPGGVAAAGVDAAAGKLRVRAFADSSGHVNLPPGSASGTNGRAEARILDAIAFQGAPVLDFHLDIDHFATGPEAESELAFSARMPLSSGQKFFFPEGKQFVSVFDLYVIGDDGGTRYTIEYGDPHTPFHQVVTGTGLPPVDFSVDLRSLNNPAFPLFSFIDLTLLEFSLHADADGSDNDNGFSNIRADQTGYIGIPNGFTSASGYAYPGYVPEPAALCLLAFPTLLLRRPRQDRAR